jgi:hypothetical protein
MRSKKRLDLRPQSRILRASFVEEGAAITGLAVQRRPDDLLNSFPLLRYRHAPRSSLAGSVMPELSSRLY